MNANPNSLEACAQRSFPRGRHKEAQFSLGNGSCKDSLRWLSQILGRMLVLVTLIGTYAGLTQTTLTKITTGPVVFDGADGQSCAWVDFDNDGDLDLSVSCKRTAVNL